MKDKNGKDLAVTVEIGQTMTTELKKADKQLAGFEEFSITTSTRNPTTGRLAVEMFLRLRTAVPAKKP